MVSAIFISYRREDAEDSARALYESLLREFGKERIFMDVEAIALGSDFRQEVEKSLDNCGVFLAVIGPNWLDSKLPNDPAGRRRLDNPGDYVRQEIATALKRGAKLPVIPVLVRNANMPSPEQLPDDLKDLPYRNALTLSHLDWDGNVQRLVGAIRPRVGSADAPPAMSPSPAFAAPHVAPVSPAMPPEPPTGSGISMNKVFLGAAALVVAVVAAYFALKPGPQPELPKDQTSQAATPAADSTIPQQQPARTPAPDSTPSPQAPRTAAQDTPTASREPARTPPESPANDSQPASGPTSGSGSPDPATPAPQIVIVMLAANSSFEDAQRCDPSCRLAVDGRVVASPFTGKAMRLKLSLGQHRFQISNSQRRCEGSFVVAEGKTTFTPSWPKPADCEMHPGRLATATPALTATRPSVDINPLVVTFGFTGSGWDKRKLWVDDRVISNNLLVPVRTRLTPGQHKFLFAGPSNHCSGTFKVSTGQTRFTMEWPARDRCMMTPSGN